MKSNVVLIGMPGAGKSTVGVVLAKILNYKFIDSDIIIQQRTKQKLRDIIALKGVEEFKRIENRINSGLNVKRCVIATGGSAVYGKEAMEHLKKIGVVVYLKTDLASLENRLGNLDRRGVVHNPGESLEDILKEREPLYEMYADVTVNENESSGVSVMAEKIERLLGL